MDLNQYLKVWLRFDESPTKDECGNQWTVNKTPTVGTDNSFNGNALHLSGGSYVYTPTPIEIGGQDFTVDFWARPSKLSGWQGLFCWSTNGSSGGLKGSLALGIEGSTLKSGACNTSSTSTFFDATIKTGITIDLYHFAVCYQHADKKIFFFVNGVLAYSTTLSQYIERAERYIFVGRMPWSASQYLEGTVDEFRIYDGIARWTEDFTPPTLFDYGGDSATISFNVDVIRHVRNSLFEWRYENYGTADLLTVEGTTVSNLPDTQSKTGSAFYQPSRQKCFDIPASNEIWIKCDIYVANANSGNRIRVYSEDANGINGWSTPSSGVKNAYVLWHNDTSITGKYRVVNATNDSSGLQTLWLHMKSGSSDGLIEYFVCTVREGRIFTAADLDYSFTGNVNAGNPFNNVYIQMDGANIYVSNLIISNVPVGFNEDVKFAQTVSFNVDAKRTVGNNISASFDAKRTIGNNISFNVDTRRTVKEVQPTAVVFEVDMKRRVKNTVTTSVDARRSLIQSLEPEPVVPDNDDDDFVSIVDIYDIHLRTGMIHICNTDADITFEGNKYISIPIEREDISRSVDDIDEDVKISMADATTEQLQFIIAGFEFRGCPVRIRQIFYPKSILDNSIYRDCFYGYVDNPAFQNGEFTCTLRSRIPKITVPRRTYQSLCNCKFADSVCQMDSARVTGSITAVVSNNQIVIDINKADNFWRNGIITIEGESRMIQKSEGALITTFYPFFASVCAGLQFSIQRGCDKTFTSCNAFGNIEHFTGFPAIPFETIYR